MALSGTFATNKDTSAGSEYPSYIYVKWSATQDIANNKSTITWKCYGGSTGSSTSKYVYAGPVVVTINGTEVYNKGSTSSRFKITKDLLLASGTIDVPHNSDGAKSIAVKISAALYLYKTNCTYSGSISLDTIPRASKITSASNITLPAACNIKWTPASSGFLYKIKFSLNDWSYTTGYIEPKTTSTYTYSAYTLSDALYAYLPDSTSGTMTAVLTTYNASKVKIGSTSSKTFTVTIPSSVVPKIDSISLTPASINDSSILLQGKNQLTIKATGGAAGAGATIKSYTFSGPSMTSTTKATSSTSSSVSIGPVSSSGSLTYTVKITDSRGRTATKTKSITCYAYSAPYISEFNAFRSYSSGDAAMDGKYFKCTYKSYCSSVNNTNSVTVTAYYKTGSTTKTKNISGGSAIIALGDNTKTYTVYLKITDKYSGTSTSQTITIFGDSRVLNITADGTGVALGKKATTKSLFETVWPIKTSAPEKTMSYLTYKGANIISSTSDDTTTNWVKQGNLATVYYNQTGQLNSQPSQYGYLLSVTAGTGSTQVHQLWLGQANGAIYHRGGNSSALNEWKTVLDSSNYTKYTNALPKTLYSSTAGVVGTVTLSSSAANFTYLEIFYTDNNSRQLNSIKVYSPNGKYVSLSAIEPSTSSSEPRLYIRSSGWTISGTSMTPGRSDLENKNRGVYAQIYPSVGGTDVDVSVTAKNYIKIVRVLGYK